MSGEETYTHPVQHTSTPVLSGGEEYHYTQPVRHTRMGGFTRPVAVCDLCGVVRPHAVRQSKSGTHGEWYYSHPHPLSFLVLESSNTRRHWYRIEGRPDEKIRPILERAGRAWENYTKGYEAVLEEINFYLGELLGEADDQTGSREAGDQVP
jgi:hypothetical protein